MNDVRFKRMVRPGETIDIEVELTERLAGAFYLQAKVTAVGKVAVRFEFACTLGSRRRLEVRAEHVAAWISCNSPAKRCWSSASPTARAWPGTSARC